jgi:hypothetical protein
MWNVEWRHEGHTCCNVGSHVDNSLNRVTARYVQIGKVVNLSMDT